MGKLAGLVLLCAASLAAQYFPPGGGGGGSGTVTTVGFTGGLVSVANPTTTPAFTVAGTSGGLPYFSAASTWASSAAGTINHVVGWGGAGNAPVDLGVAATGNALTSNPLSQFASTTSAQLLATLSNPTGTGAAVFGTSPTLVTPAITTSSTLTNNAIGNTSTDGMVLTNTTAALTGQQQFSPRIHLIGQGWGTTAPASAQGEIILENAPFRDTTVDPRLTLSYVEGAGSQTTLVQFMPLPTFHANPAIFLGPVTPSATNYALSSNGSTDTYLNGSSNVFARVNNTSVQQWFGGGTTVTGTFTASSTIKGGGYQSSDGTAGATVTTCTSFKNGLCVAGT